MRLTCTQRTTLGGHRGGPPQVELFVGHPVDVDDVLLDAYLDARGGTGRRLLSAGILSVTPTPAAAVVVVAPPAPDAPPVVGPTPPPQPITLPAPAPDPTNVPELSVNDALPVIAAETSLDKLASWGIGESAGKARRTILNALAQRTQRLTAAAAPPVVAPAEPTPPAAEPSEPIVTVTPDPAPDAPPVVDVPPST